MGPGGARIHRLSDATGRLIVCSSRDISNSRQHAQDQRPSEERLGLEPACPDGGPVPFAMLADCMPPADLQLLMQAIRQALQARGEFSVALQLDDVTQRKHAEAALRESEARQRAIFDNSAVGMAEHALDGTWINVNPRLCQITGYSREALMALDLRQLTHPDDRGKAMPQLRQVVRGTRDASRRETRCLRQDGSTIWVAISSAAVRDASGRARCFVSVVEDITERRRIEAELSSHRQNLPAEVAERTQALQQAMHDRGEAQPHERALLQRAAGQRVLLAEDNLVNQELASELLRAVGLVVDLANDGQEALNLATQHDYDLVLMDMQMPVMDGLAATRALRAMPRHVRTPILAMTANAFGEDRRACLNAGMDDHIAKPVDPELLYATLGRWLPVRLDGGLAPAQHRPPPAPQALDGTAAPQALDGTAAPQALDGTAAPQAVQHAAAVAPVLSPVSASAASASPDFSGIPGLSMSRALLYLPGRDQVYVRVLRQFAHGYAQGVPGLGAALQRADWADARRQLHALRGACGAVGATGLQAQALALEQQLQALDDADGDNGAAAATGPAPDAAALQASLLALVAAVAGRLAAAAPAQPVGAVQAVPVAAQ